MSELLLSFKLAQLDLNNKLKWTLNIRVGPFNKKFPNETEDEAKFIEHYCVCRLLT